VDLGVTAAGSGVAGMVPPRDGVPWWWWAAQWPGARVAMGSAPMAGRRRIEPLDPKDRLNWNH